MKNRAFFRPCTGAMLAGLGWIGLTAGCSDSSARLNAPPQGHTDRQHASQEYYVPMTDNAMLADMSMSPAHFVPHQSELNATGVRRLKRYAEIMKIYGGKLLYDGTENEDMVKERMNRIETFLVSAGLERSAFSVEPGFAGGAGMRATESAEIRKATTFAPEAKGEEEGGGGIMGMLAKLAGGKK